MSFIRAKTKSVSKAEFTERFSRDVHILCDFGPKKGRPSKTVLGDERRQMTIFVGLEVATALVSALEAQGEVLDASAHFLYDPAERAKWVSNRLQGWSSMSYAAEGVDFFATVERKFGSLITIKYAVINGSRVAVRIARAGATPAEARIASKLLIESGALTAKNRAQAAKALNAFVSFANPDETFEEAKARYYEAVRNGEISPEQEKE